MPETCWETIDNKHLTVASCWFSLSLHNLLTMHSHRHLKRRLSCTATYNDDNCNFTYSFYFSLLQHAVTRILCISVRTLHFSFFIVLHSVCKTSPKMEEKKCSICFLSWHLASQSVLQGGSPSCVWAVQFNYFFKTWYEDYVTES